jgi:hypothetical protein
MDLAADCPQFYLGGFPAIHLIIRPAFLQEAAMFNVNSGMLYRLSYRGMLFIGKEKTLFEDHCAG